MEMKLVDNTTKYQKERLDELKENLRKTLKEIFQINSPDLNFGIYRIMNQKRSEIEKFINHDLIDAIDEEFGKYDESLRAEIVNKKEAVKRKISDEIADDALTESGILEKYLGTKSAEKLNQQWKDLCEKENNLSMSDVQKAEVFAHLEEFFSRYFIDGDFVSQRRYSRDGKYAIPYNGEEVFLHWVNKDQYYVKSGLFLNDHEFKVGEYNIRFEIVNLEDDIDNNPETDVNYTFMLYDGDYNVDFIPENNTLIARFSRIVVNKPKAKINDVIESLTSEILSKTCIPPDLKKALKGEEKSSTNPEILKKHISAFLNENKTDLFIHKNLNRFLNNELDVYIKTEIFKLDDSDDLSVNNYISRARIFKKISQKIISQLSEFEDFQKALWEKKKFVIKANYCITVDYIPHCYYEEICSNSKQQDKWKIYLNHLKTQDKSSQQQLISPVSSQITPEDLLRHPYLMVDTGLFSDDFRDEILENLINPISDEHEQITDLDEATNGLVIHSENWQALNLLSKRYSETIGCIYIDPPYNTGSDGFVYSDNYKHSSWLSMMYDRLHLAYDYLKKDGIIFTSIDNREKDSLSNLMSTIYYTDKLPEISVKVKDAAGVGQQSMIFDVLEYLLVGTKSHEAYKEISEKFDLSDYEIIDQPINGYKHYITDYGEPKLVKTITRGQVGEIKIYSCINPSISEDANSLEFPGEYLKHSSDIYADYNPNGGTIKQIKHEFPTGLSYIEFTPSKGKNKGVLSKIYFLNRRILSCVNDILKVENDGKKITVYKKSKLSNLWSFSNSSLDSEGAVTFKNGKKPLALTNKIIDKFSEKDSTILDFFAGSGTVAHSVLDLNKKTNSNRKYIMIEQGDYFYSITKPRVEKMVYSLKWNKERIPIINKKNPSGQSHIFKYMDLEQYDDTLDNIEFNEKGSRQASLFTSTDYLLNYNLDFDTKDSPCRLNVKYMSTPFAYQLRTRRENGFENVERDQDGFRFINVDLVETFNYLLGLHVLRIVCRENNGLKYKIVHGKTRDEKLVTIIWRNSPSEPEKHKKELEEDAEFIENILLKDFECKELYVNGYCFAKNAKAIEPIFKNLMGA